MFSVRRRPPGPIHSVFERNEALRSHELALDSNFGSETASKGIVTISVCATNRRVLVFLLVLVVTFF